MASHSRVVGKRHEKNAATVISDTTETWHEEKKHSTSHSCEGALLLANCWIFYSAKVLRFCHVSPQPLLVQQTHPSLSVPLPSQPSRDPHQDNRDSPESPCCPALAGPGLQTQLALQLLGTARSKNTRKLEALQAHFLVLSQCN